VAARRRFFDGIVKACRKSLPPDLQRFTHSGSFNLMKVWYGYQRIHFEVVLDQQINRIEVGLHFEDGPASTIAYLELLDRQILALKEALGYQTELERWTQSWGRIYELHSLDELTPEVTRLIAGRLDLYIRTLWPTIELSGVQHVRET
jgi:hypothetical protein